MTRQRGAVGSGRFMNSRLRPTGSARGSVGGGCPRLRLRPRCPRRPGPCCRAGLWSLGPPGGRQLASVPGDAAGTAHRRGGQV